MKTIIKSWATTLVALIISIFNLNVNAQTGNPTEVVQASGPYPVDLAFLSSEAALRAYAVENSRLARVWIGMNSATTSSGSNGIAWDKGVNSVTLFSRIDSLFDNLWVKTFNPNDYVWTCAATQNADGDDLMYGGGGARLVYGKGGYDLPKIANVFCLASTIPIPFSGVESARALITDPESGQTIDRVDLQVRSGKVYFQSDMAGRVILQVKIKGGQVLAYDLTNGGVGIPEETVILMGNTTSHLDHMIVLRDFVGPYKHVEPSYKGVGTNPTFEVIATGKEIPIDISVSSTEGAVPVSFKYKKLGEVVWQDAPCTNGRLVMPPSGFGTMYIVPVWNPSEFHSRLPYIGYGDGRG